MEINYTDWGKFNLNSFIAEISLTHVFRIETALYYQDIANSYPAVLSSEELQKALRFRLAQHQEDFIARKHFLRSILSIFTGTEPSLLNFKKTGNRKPSLEEIEFNTTHSGRYSFFALSNQPLGIDTEEVKYDFDFHALVDQCFDDEEQIALKAGDEIVNFYALWSRKEAILKATGEGLVDDLKQINCLGHLHTRMNTDYHMHTVMANDVQVLSIASSTLPKHTQFWSL